MPTSPIPAGRIHRPGGGPDSGLSASGTGPDTGAGGRARDGRTRGDGGRTGEDERLEIEERLRDRLGVRDERVHTDADRAERPALPVDRVEGEDEDAAGLAGVARDDDTRAGEPLEARARGDTAGAAQHQPLGRGGPRARPGMRRNAESTSARASPEPSRG